MSAAFDVQESAFLGTGIGNNPFSLSKAAGILAAAAWAETFGAAAEVLALASVKA